MTGKNFKSVMERLYSFASKGTVETMQRLLPEKSISLMIYLHANNRSLMVEIDREVLQTITNSVKWCLRTILQAREKTKKKFHGAIPKLLHSIKHSRAKVDPYDDDLHHRIYLIVDIFQAVFADLSPLEAYDFADTRNNLSGEPLLFNTPDFTNLNTKSYLPDFYKEKKVIKRSKRDESMLSDDENNDTEVNEMIVTTANAADDPEPSTKKRQRSRAVQPPSSSSETTDNDEDQSTQIEEKENARKTRKRKVSPMKRSAKRLSK